MPRIGNDWLKIKIARPEDALEVAILIKDVYEPFSGSFRPTALQWTPQAVGACPGDWLLARTEGRLVGVVRHHTDPEGYTLDALAVGAHDRRRAVASRLVADVERCAVAARARQMIVALRRDLVANIALFEGHGYHLDRPYPPHHDLYTKDLRHQP